MTSLDVATKADAAFDFSAMDARYVSPTYIRAHFREYLHSFDKGVYWLRAPALTGKTAFVRGIIAKRLAKDQTTSEGIDSKVATGMSGIGVHIREDGCASPRQFVEALQAAFAAEFNLDEAQRAASAANIRYGDLAEARADFLTWLQQLRDVAAAKGETRLLVCVDGLEQMAEAGSGASGEPYSILDLLPDVSEVPANIILLLTSRPAEEWTTPLFEPTAAKFGGGFGFMAREITLEDDAYVKMLRAYFWDAVRNMFRSRAMVHLEQLLENKARLSKEKDTRLAGDMAFRDGLKADWKKLTNKYPRYSMDQLPVGELKQTLDQIDKLWTDAMDRGDRRFGLVSLVLARIVDGSLALEQVAEAPKGEALFAHLQAV